MLKKFFTIFSFAIITASFTSVCAQTKPINITTTAVPFLRIGPDARAGGMGDVGIATSADANATFWNIAKLPFSQSKSAIGVSFTPWLRGLGVRDIYLTSIAGYHQLDDRQAITGGLKYFSLGDIQFTDEMGNNLNSFRPREYSFDAGYSRKLSDNIALGIGLRYIHSNLAKGSFNGQSYKAGKAVAGNISLFRDGTSGMTNSGLNWGIALSNLGSKISYTDDANRKDFLPANLGVGLAYTKVFDENTKATFALDVNKLLVPEAPQLSGTNSRSDSLAIVEFRDRGVLSSVFNSFGDAPGQVSAGAELMLQNILALRGGYFFESRKQGNRKYFTVGAGLDLPTFNLNFSFLIPSGSNSARSPLENTFKTSVSFNFNNN